MTSVLNKIMPNGQARETLREQLRTEMLTALHEAAKTQPHLANLFNIPGVTDDNWTFEGLSMLYTMSVVEYDASKH
jgi:hypothetical protein